MTSQSELLARIAEGLARAEIPYMVVGSLASSFHAEPRTTRDIDIVIDPSPDRLRRFVSELPTDDFYADAGAALEALERRTGFNVIEVESGWKVDLMIRKDRPFSREEFGRRLAVELLGTETHVATAEDTIIAKLEWAQAGASDQQLRDVASIIVTDESKLDLDYLQRWIEALELRDSWERAQRLTRG